MKMTNDKRILAKTVVISNLHNSYENKIDMIEVSFTNFSRSLLLS
jgi:hypothetical protein